MASDDVIAGQAAIDQNVMEMKALINRASQFAPIQTKQVCDFLFDADNPQAAADQLDSMRIADRRFFLSLIIPFACLGHQMIAMSMLADLDEGCDGK